MCPDFAIYAILCSLPAWILIYKRMFVQKRFCRISTSMKFAAHPEL